MAAVVDLECLLKVSRAAAALHLMIIAWADEHGICEIVDYVAMRSGFSRIEFENCMEELVQEKFVEEFYIDEFPDSSGHPYTKRNVRITDFEPPAQSRLSASKWNRLRQAVFVRDDFTCRYCGMRCEEPECDHVDPLSRGGTNEIGNLVTACRACNRAKRDKLLDKWKGRADVELQLIENERVAR